MDVVDFGFSQCWLAAVATVRILKRHPAGIRYRGTTYAFAAIAEVIRADDSYSSRSPNIWRQSPSTYRSARHACDIHNGLVLPVSIWSDLPGAVVHHHFWSPLTAPFHGEGHPGERQDCDNHMIDAL